MYNKRQLLKSNDKKILHKVKKRWVVISLAMFMMLGGAGLATNHSVHAASVSPETSVAKKSSSDKSTLPSNKPTNTKVGTTSETKTVTPVNTSATKVGKMAPAKKDTLADPAPAGDVLATGHWGTNSNSPWTLYKDGALSVGNEGTYTTLADNSSSGSLMTLPNGADDTSRTGGTDPNGGTIYYGNPMTTHSNQVHLAQLKDKSGNVINDKVKSIVFNDVGVPTNCQGLFGGFQNLKSINLTGLTEHNQTNDEGDQKTNQAVDNIQYMDYMFADDPQLKAVDLGPWSNDYDGDGSSEGEGNIQTMQGMFMNDHSLNSIIMPLGFDPSSSAKPDEWSSSYLKGEIYDEDLRWEANPHSLGSFLTYHLHDMSYMFYNDYSLPNFDMSDASPHDGTSVRGDYIRPDFNDGTSSAWSQVYTMDNMFNNCYNLNWADFSGMDLFKTSFNKTFQNCLNLESINFYSHDAMNSGDDSGWPQSGGDDYQTYRPYVVDVKYLDPNTNKVIGASTILRNQDANGSDDPNVSDNTYKDPHAAGSLNGKTIDVTNKSNPLGQVAEIPDGYTLDGSNMDGLTSNFNNYNIDGIPSNDPEYGDYKNGNYNYNPGGNSTTIKLNNYRIGEFKKDAMAPDYQVPEYSYTPSMHPIEHLAVNVRRNGNWSIPVTIVNDKGVQKQATINLPTNSKGISQTDVEHAINSSKIIDSGYKLPSDWWHTAMENSSSTKSNLWLPNSLNYQQLNNQHDYYNYDNSTGNNNLIAMTETGNTAQTFAGGIVVHEVAKPAKARVNLIKELVYPVSPGTPGAFQLPGTFIAGKSVTNPWVKEQDSQSIPFTVSGKVGTAKVMDPTNLGSTAYTNGYTLYGLLNPKNGLSSRASNVTETLQQKAGVNSLTYSDPTDTTFYYMADYAPVAKPIHVIYYVKGTRTIVSEKDINDYNGVPIYTGYSIGDITNAGAGGLGVPNGYSSAGPAATGTSPADRNTTGTIGGPNPGGNGFTVDTSDQYAYIPVTGNPENVPVKYVDKNTGQPIIGSGITLDSTSGAEFDPHTNSQIQSNIPNGYTYDISVNPKISVNHSADGYYDVTDNGSGNTTNTLSIKVDPGSINIPINYYVAGNPSPVGHSSISTFKNGGPSNNITWSSDLEDLNTNEGPAIRSYVSSNLNNYTFDRILGANEYNVALLDPSRNSGSIQPIDVELTGNSEPINIHFNKEVTPNSKAGAMDAGTDSDALEANYGSVVNLNRTMANYVHTHYPNYMLDYTNSDHSLTVGTSNTAQAYLIHKTNRNSFDFDLEEDTPGPAYTKMDDFSTDYPVPISGPAGSTIHFNPMTVPSLVHAIPGFKLENPGTEGSRNDPFDLTMNSPITSSNGRTVYYTAEKASDNEDVKPLDVIYIDQDTGSEVGHGVADGYMDETVPNSTLATSAKNSLSDSTATAWNTVKEHYALGSNPGSATFGLNENAVDINVTGKPIAPGSFPITLHKENASGEPVSTYTVPSSAYSSFLPTRFGESHTFNASDFASDLPGYDVDDTLNGSGKLNHPESFDVSANAGGLNVGGTLVSNLDFYYKPESSTGLGSVKPDTVQYINQNNAPVGTTHTINGTMGQSGSLTASGIPSGYAVDPNNTAKGGSNTYSIDTTGHSYKVYLIGDMENNPVTIKTIKIDGNGHHSNGTFNTTMHGRVGDKGSFSRLPSTDSGYSETITPNANGMIGATGYQWPVNNPGNIFEETAQPTNLHVNYINQKGVNVGTQSIAGKTDQTVNLDYPTGSTPLHLPSDYSYNTDHTQTKSVNLLPDNGSNVNVYVIGSSSNYPIPTEIKVFHPANSGGRTFDGKHWQPTGQTINYTYVYNQDAGDRIYEDSGFQYDLKLAMNNDAQAYFGSSNIAGSDFSNLDPSTAINMATDNHITFSSGREPVMNLYVSGPAPSRPSSDSGSGPAIAPTTPTEPAQPTTPTEPTQPTTPTEPTKPTKPSNKVKSQKWHNVKAPYRHVNFMRPVLLHNTVDSIGNPHSHVVTKIDPHSVTLFVHKAVERNGVMRFLVNYHGLKGWVTGNVRDKYTRHAYYRTNRRNFMIKTLRPILLHTNKVFNSKTAVRKIKAGTKLRVRSEIKYGRLTRFVVKHGYITSNNDYVKML